jgi:5-methylcytosine-specific restriction protein A
MANKPEHIKRSWVPERVAFERAVDNSEFYNSRAWRNLRKRFLNNNPLCIVCEREDIITVATVADHVKAMSQGGEAMDEGNLQPMCKKCHNSKSSHESRSKRGYGVKSLNK